MTETFNVDPQKLNKPLGLGLSLKSEPWIEVRLKYHVKQGQQMEYLLCCTKSEAEFSSAVRSCSNNIKT